MFWLMYFLLESAKRRTARYRSEEHTSELQSRSDLVCRLLLEKKKNKSIPQPPPLQGGYLRKHQQESAPLQPGRGHHYPKPTHPAAKSTCVDRRPKPAVTTVAA